MGREDIGGMRTGKSEVWLRRNEERVVSWKAREPDKNIFFVFLILQLLIVKNFK